jgi:DNA-binding NarL/FixJ family response regulator
VRRTKVLLATMPPVVRGLLVHLLRSQTDVEVVHARAPGPLGLVEAVRHAGADLVIEVVPNPEEMPAGYPRVLDEYPDVAILALARDGEAGRLYRRAVTQEPVTAASAESLMELIRGPFPDRGEARGGVS